MSFRPNSFKLLTGTALVTLLAACGSTDDSGSGGDDNTWNPTSSSSVTGSAASGGVSSSSGTSSGSGGGASASTSAGPGGSTTSGSTGGAPPVTSGTGGDSVSGTGGVGPGTGGAGGAGAGGAASGAGGGPVAGDGYPEHTGADCEVTAGALKKNEKLPNPFVMDDGTAITTKAAWKCRRAEIKAEIEKYEIGPKPEPPKVEASVSGKTLNVVVTTAAGSITLTSSIGGSGRCVAIGMNGNAGLISGCTQIPFMHDQVVGYAGGGGSHSQSDPFYKVYPELWGKIGKYNAWSWGISRLIDGIEQVKDELNVDPTKIGLQGCSYAGKMALFGGAFDERVALTVAQESGGGGITSWRTSQNFTTRTGTNIEKIDNTNGSWFLGSMKQLDPYSLPHDHHELIAMIAPRAVIALGNQDFEWLGDESGWKSINAAKEVWKAMGVPENIGFDFTSNHGHCAAPAAQQASVKAFVDRFLKGMDAETEIVIRPQEGNFDLDFTNVIDWETPTLR